MNINEIILKNDNNVEKFFKNIAAFKLLLLNKIEIYLGVSI